MTTKHDLQTCIPSLFQMYNQSSFTSIANSSLTKTFRNTCTCLQNSCFEIMFLIIQSNLPLMIKVGTLVSFMVTGDPTCTRLVRWLQIYEYIRHFKDVKENEFFKWMDKPACFCPLQSVCLCNIWPSCVTINSQWWSHQNLLQWTQIPSAENPLIYKQKQSL